MSSGIGHDRASAGEMSESSGGLSGGRATISVDIRSLLNRLNAHCTQALEGAAGVCLARGHYEMTTDTSSPELLETPQNDIDLILHGFSCDGRPSGAVTAVGMVANWQLGKARSSAFVGMA